MTIRNEYLPTPPQNCRDTTPWKEYSLPQKEKLPNPAIKLVLSFVATKYSRLVLIKDCTNSEVMTNFPVFIDCARMKST